MRHGISSALALAALLSAPAAALEPWPGETAPDWELVRPDGQRLRFYDDDRVAVLLFWATWCPYCRALMPHLDALAREYADRPVAFYALNVWEDGDPVAHLRERDYRFELLLDAEPVAARYGVKGTPGLFVVDRRHVIRYARDKGTEAEAAAAAVRAAIDAALAAAGPRR